MEPVRLAGLDVEDDPAFHRRATRVGRAARVVLAVIVGLALLGVFGGAGPLVGARAAGPDGFAVRYDRFARLDAPLRIHVVLPRGDSAFTLTGDLAADLRVDAVSPAPAAEEATAEGVRVVASSPGGTVTVHGRPLRFGRLRGAVALDGGRRLRIAHVVYP